MLLYTQVGRGLTLVTAVRSNTTEGYSKGRRWFSHLKHTGSYEPRVFFEGGGERAVRVRGTRVHRDRTMSYLTKDTVPVGAVAVGGAETPRPASQCRHAGCSSEQ